MQGRQYYIDWIRIFLIFSVFLFHIGMVFHSGSWHVKNDIRYEVLSPIMQLLHAWRMPLLFLVSGAGTRFALGVRTTRQFAAERTKRLLIPFLAGILILCPVQIYIERITQYSSFFDFYPHFFDGIYPTGNFSWNHLWYIFYLFFIIMIFIPFIWFFRSVNYAVLEKVIEKLASIKGGLLLLYIPLLCSQLLLRPFFPIETHAFVNDWAIISLFFLYFLFGFVLLGNSKVVGIIVRDRSIWLITTVLVTVMMFLIIYFTNFSLSGRLFSILSLLISWSIGLCILGYARQYINKDNVYRNQLNIGIYSFFLLHQPVIVLVAYFVTHLQYPVLLKALLIFIISMILIWTIYRYLITPFNFMRVIFGLKKKAKEVVLKPQPALVVVESSRNIE